MNRIRNQSHQSQRIRPVGLLSLAALGTVLVGLAGTLPVRADQTRVCRNYGVVRDLSDHEAPLLPRHSTGHCARSYQTLYQTYRVKPQSEDARTTAHDRRPANPETPTASDSAHHAPNQTAPSTIQ